MKNITVKTTFTAIAALFFATSLYAIDMKSICMPRAFMEVMVQGTGGYQASHVCATNQQFYWVVHL